MLRDLRILLAGADAEASAALRRSLSGIVGLAISSMPVGAALCAAAAQGPDMLVIWGALPDDTRIEELRRGIAADPLPIVVWVDRDDRAARRRATTAGMANDRLVATTASRLGAIVAAVLAMHRHYGRVRDQLDDATAALAEIRTIARAKAMLMHQRGIEEPQAYRWLRRKAMNENKRIVAVAAELLDAAPDAPDCCDAQEAVSNAHAVSTGKRPASRRRSRRS